MRISDWSSDVCSSDLVAASASRKVRRAAAVKPPLRAVRSCSARWRALEMIVSMTATPGLNAPGPETRLRVRPRFAIRQCSRYVPEQRDDVQLNYTMWLVTKDRNSVV